MTNIAYRSSMEGSPRIARLFRGTGTASQRSIRDGAEILPLFRDRNDRLLARMDVIEGLEAVAELVKEYAQSRTEAIDGLDTKSRSQAIRGFSSAAWRAHDILTVLDGMEKSMQLRLGSISFGRDPRVKIRLKRIMDTDPSVDADPSIRITIRTLLSPETWRVRMHEAVHCVETANEIANDGDAKLYSLKRNQPSDHTA